MDHTLACLTAWLPRQRWYTATGTPPRLRLLSETALPSTDPIARVRVLIVADDAPTPPIVYQVPLVERPEQDAVGTRAHVGATERGRSILDGPHDPAYTSALLTSIVTDSGPATAEVLSGEQSNTSIIYRPASGTPIICKVFRQLNAGLNPDIELQTALADAGSPHVPHTVGRVDGIWKNPDDPTTEDAGSLAFAQEFLPGVDDAWRVALRAAHAGIDFTADAAALGAATADVHVDLARLFPTATADGTARAAVVTTWLRRLAIALAEVPALAAHRTAIETIYAAATDVPWPALQRIHGDYHLGQVLQVPGRGWVLLDFEGEPMRPMVERRKPDLALRDIAGMLRSFDYVAGSLRLEHAGGGDDASDDIDAWADAARGAFLAGYRNAHDGGMTGQLLAALELDKAVYETIYEARHRPSWVAIPLRAIERLVAR